MRSAVLLGLFAGTATGAGFLLSGVPNVELMSLIVALAGAVLGVRSGLVCGGLAAGIYSLASPYGVPVVWVLVAQMIGMAGAGTLGALWGSRLRGPRISTRPWLSGLLAGCLGLAATTWFELVTTGAVMVGFGLDPRVVLLGATPFFFLHAGSNIMIFALFFPPLCRRLSRLDGHALRGHLRPPAIILLGLVAWSGVARAQDPASAAADSLQVSPAPAVTRAPHATVNGWRRGLWHPFTESLIDYLQWHGEFVPVQDGGLGAPVRILGEFSTSPYPVVLRDGLPLGTGHVLADNPGLIPVAGMSSDSEEFGLDGWGNSGGWVDLNRLDPNPGSAYSAYQGTKGRHETYMRNLQLLTPRAPWRFGIEFQENLDKEGYNFTSLPGDIFDPTPDLYFPGHARLRQSHARLTRNLDPASRLDVDYDNGRLTKDQLPSLATGHEEIWSDGMSVDMHSGTPRWGIRTALFWRSRTVNLGHASTSSDTTVRGLNTGREGALMELRLGSADSVEAAAGRSAIPPSGAASLRLRLAVSSWTLDDTGPDTLWAGPGAGAVHLDGQEGRGTLAAQVRRAGLVWRVQGGGLWTNRSGWDPTTTISLERDQGFLRLKLFRETGGRPPRSDELGTFLKHDVAGRVLVLEPNDKLRREKTRRMGGNLGLELGGLRLALEGVTGKLTDGITWVPETSISARGRLANGVNMDFRRLTASLSHQGRFLGWGRIRYEGTWQDYTSDGLEPSFKPPRQYSRVQIMWENHFFEEDGVLEIALFSTHVGAMTDPWDVTRSYVIPARTLEDLVVGFRLVGADLSLAFRNLTGQRYRLTAGAWGPGSETVMRLAWSFRR